MNVGRCVQGPAAVRLHRDDAGDGHLRADECRLLLGAHPRRSGRLRRRRLGNHALAVCVCTDAGES